jgi:putative Mg2+ transporter-C (MgtC) family protein
LEQTIAELPSLEQLARVASRLLAAAVLGGLVGAEREWVGRAAGLRTHMVVALGSAVFVLIPVETGASRDSVTAVIQGVATGVGFIGAGTILKAADQREVQGLTTAATIWMTGALGIAAGIGHWWLAAVGVAIAWAILTVLTGLSRRLQAKADAQSLALVREPAPRARTDSDRGSAG